MVWRRQNKKLVCKPIRHWEKKRQNVVFWSLAPGWWPKVTLSSPSLQFNRLVIKCHTFTSERISSVMESFSFIQKTESSSKFKFTRKSVDKTGIVKRRSCKNFAKVLFWIHETRLFCWFRIGSHCFIQVLSWIKESPQKLPREPGSEKWWKV